jgi:excisionase family DNA binding protein
MDTAPHPTDPTDSGTGWALLTVEAAANQLRIGRTTMYALLKNGDIASLRIGRLRRVPAEALTAYTTRLIAEQNAA